MFAMLPADFSLPHLLAMSLLLLSCFSYQVILKITGKETINSKR